MRLNLCTLVIAFAAAGTDATGIARAGQQAVPPPALVPGPVMPPTSILPATVQPVAGPAATPAPAASVPRGDWRDWPLTPGAWVYRQDARGSIALFGAPGADADFTIRCDRLAGQMFLSRKGAAPGNAPITIRTSSALRTISALPTGGSLPYMAASMSANDPLLDAMGFSRGRFIVEQATLPLLVIPAWAEVLRVVEDCRR